MIRIFSIVMMTLMLVACSDEPETASPKQDSSLSLEEAMVVGNNTLGFSLLKTTPENEDGNIFLSPFSLYMTLALLNQGAEAETAAEISEMLGVKQADKAAMNEIIQQWRDDIVIADQALDVTIAQSIWLNEHYRFQDAFIETAETYYDAEMNVFHPMTENAEKQMNDWVKEATKDKITEIVQGPIDSNLVAVLLNAIYFKGDWTYPFDEALTEKKPFDNGETKETVAMMTLDAKLSYFENESLQAVKLPYDDGQIEMTIYLPDNIDDFTEQFTQEQWQTWEQTFEEEKGTVELPRFQLAYEAKFNQALQQLGMVVPFTRERANFFQMIDEDDTFWIDAIKQKTYIAVDEKGAEAAGSTSAEITTTSMPLEEDTFHIQVNRPFFAIISDVETDTILFIGKILNPAEK